MRGRRFKNVFFCKIHGVFNEDTWQLHDRFASCGWRDMIL